MPMARSISTADNLLAQHSNTARCHPRRHRTRCLAGHCRVRATGRRCEDGETAKTVQGVFQADPPDPSGPKFALLRNAHE